MTQNTKSVWGLKRVYFGIGSDSRVYNREDMIKRFSGYTKGSTKFNVPNACVDMSAQAMELRTLCQVIMNRR